MPPTEQIVGDDLETLRDRFAVAAMAETVESFAVDFVVDETDRAVGKQGIDAASVGGAEAIRKIVIHFG
jgi:hypothetical protein